MFARTLTALTTTLCLLAACNTADESKTELLTAEARGLPTAPPGPKATLSVADCKAKGGSVVGDIGDGAVLAPDYTCESNGKPPIARVVAEEAGPQGVEGSVCCGPPLSPR